MRIFKTKDFARFARRGGLGDAALCDAIDRAERGLIDADLGGGVIKQRVARPGQGRSGGYRVVIAYRAASRAVFLHGFAKSAKDNVTDDELAALKEIAAALLAAGPAAVVKALNGGKWIEVKRDANKEVQE